MVWQKAMELVEIVYRLMKVFPADERFRLCDQLSRAVVSIPSNIAEGNGRESKAEYARFLGIARGSLYETETQLEIFFFRRFYNFFTVKFAAAIIFEFFRNERR